jgi:crotonobetainyl-CoA:carnitine CoA-transferase CaiB-like acyl-CoA transferase
MVTPVPTEVRRATYLRNVRILELGDGISGSAAAAVLGSLGAQVDKVRQPSAPVHRCTPAFTTATGQAESVLGELLDRGKSVVALPPVEAMAGYDLVISDRFGDHDAASLPHDSDEYVAFVAAAPAKAWVTISPFGLRGPRRNWTGSELSIAAASGLMAADPDTGRPIKLGGHQALIGAGHVAALAAVHAIDIYRSSREPAHLDVSAQDAAIVTGPVLRLAHAMFRCVGGSGARRNGAPAGFYHCRDGLVRISAMEDHQFQALVRALGDPPWAEQFAAGHARIERADELDDLVSAEISGWSKVECEERMQRAGVPATAIYNVEDIIAWPQFRSRASFDTVRLGGTESVAVGPAFRLMRADRGAPAERPRPSGLARLRVAEAGHVLAVPLATSLLGAMGAFVTKLEDPHRLDVYRRRGPYMDGTSGAPQPDGRPGLERSAYFAVVNHSKRSLALDLERDREQVAAVLEASDVLIENLGPRRARRLRLDAVSATDDHPHLLAVSSSGYGQDGPWSSYKAYAYNLHAACGLCSQTRTSTGKPAEIDLAWGDLISAYALATIVAAYSIAGDSPGAAGRQAIDFSMAELLAARFNEKIGASVAGLPGAEPEDGSSHLAPSAPNSVYAGADRRWLAISVTSDAAWKSLCQVLNAPDSLIDLGAGGASGRMKAQDDIDVQLAALVGDWKAAELAEHLQRGGVPAAVVADQFDLLADEHLRVRGLFPSVEHPVWGTNRLVGLPWQIAGAGPITLGAPPLLGATELSEVTCSPGLSA